MRQRQGPFVPAALAALALFAGCSRAQTTGAKEKQQRMPGMMVTVTPTKAAVLPGESLVVKSTVQNRGAAAVTVPSDQMLEPLSYRLETEGAPAPVSYQVSWTQYHEQYNLGLAPVTPLAMTESLAPGGVQMRNEDLAHYSSQPFAIGKYRLTAAWTQGQEQAVSGFTRVVVSAPKLEAWSSEICRRTEELRSVFAHRREDGDLVLYERSAEPNHPEFGVFRPRVRLGKKTVSSVAPAVVLEDSGQGNWLAWISEGKLQVAGVLADELNAQPPAQPVELGEPRLIAPGFHFGPGRALFFVTGKGPQGQAIELWGSTTTELRRFWQAPLGPATTVRVLARKRAGAPQFVVVFEEPRGAAGTRLWRRDYDLRGAQGEARVLAEFPAPLLAWSLEPTDYPSPATLAATHRGEQAQDVLVRTVGLEGEGAAPPRKLPAFVEPADLWAVTEFSGRLHVAARTGTRIKYSETGWTAWKDVGESGPGAGWLHLFAPHSVKLWAEWCVVNRGPQRTLLLQTRDAID